MITTGSKLYFGSATAALLAAFAYGWGTDGGMLGVLTFGLRGSVGEQAGYTILVLLAAALVLLGIATSAFRDADAEAAAAVARLEVVPEAVPAQGASYWPIAGAFAAALVVLGVVISPVLFVGGLLLGLVALLEWTIKAWSERATGDPEVNRQIRNRLLYPLEIPLAGAAGIVLLVACFSRVLLALPKDASSAIAIGLGVVILTMAFLIAYRPTVSKDAIAGILVVFAIAVVAGGIIAAAHGTRKFGEEHGAEGGLAPVATDVRTVADQPGFAS
jgi:hypothetical protein